MSERGRFLGAFLGVVALHCVAYEPGIEAEVRVAGAPATVAFYTGGGERVELEEAVLHIDGVELRRCETAWTLGSVARAHELELGNGPWRLDLAGGGTIDESLIPAPGRYCALVVHVDGRAFGSVSARLSGRMAGATMNESIADPFDLVIVLPAPLELDDPGDRPMLELRIDQRKLFDHEGTLAERLQRVATVSAR
ncbi:MAG: hypothetical protein JJ863_18810 [Deltaproteobacteria bacterium]|nr:hypothetical protein [Deltaproteobacteria bacterium]